jgi:sugar O-acyltransferase (sialic acid O-acetyltransferase NeuD family)
MTEKLKPLVIIGAGGLGREVAWLVADINRQRREWDFVGFVDDGVQDKTPEGYPVLGTLNYFFELSSHPWAVVAIADSKARKAITQQLHFHGINIATLIHPSVSMSGFVQIGAGSIVCSGVVITTNVSLGQASIVNPKCFIGHDTVLEDFVSLMPASSLAGEVKVGEGCCFGLNSCVINRTNIGKWSIIGAGATVISDIPDYSVAVGVPARVIKYRDMRSEDRFHCRL